MIITQFAVTISTSIKMLKDILTKCAYYLKLFIEYTVYCMMPYKSFSILYSEIPNIISMVTCYFYL